MMLKLEDAAIRLGISTLEMRRLTLGTNTIPYKRSGPRRIIIDQADLDIYIKSLQPPENNDLFEKP